MDAPWQLAWVRGRLVRRWIVERMAGRRPAIVRVLFVETAAREMALVVRDLGQELGEGWTVDATALGAAGDSSGDGGPFDLVWALGLPTHGAWDDRLRVLAALGGSLAPDGCIVLSPTETAASRAGLAACSAPGVFLSYAWADPPLPVRDAAAPARTPSLDAVRSDREIRELERSNVLRALDRAEWKVSGKQGAAELLGIHPSTLRDRMRAFGIARRR